MKVFYPWQYRNTLLMIEYWTSDTFLLSLMTQLCKVCLGLKLHQWSRKKHFWVVWLHFVPAVKFSCSEISFHNFSNQTVIWTKQHPEKKINKFIILLNVHVSVYVFCLENIQLFGISWEPVVQPLCNLIIRDDLTENA